MLNEDVKSTGLAQQVPGKWHLLLPGSLGPACSVSIVRSNLGFSRRRGSGRRASRNLQDSWSNRTDKSKHRLRTGHTPQREGGGRTQVGLLRMKCGFIYHHGSQTRTHTPPLLCMSQSCHTSSRNATSSRQPSVGFQENPTFPQDFSQCFLLTTGSRKPLAHHFPPEVSYSLL